jgi:hypothetical protein
MPADDQLARTFVFSYFLWSSGRGSGGMGVGPRCRENAERMRLTQRSRQSGGKRMRLSTALRGVSAGFRVKLAIPVRHRGLSRIACDYSARRPMKHGSSLSTRIRRFGMLRKRGNWAANSARMSSTPSAMTLRATLACTFTRMGIRPTRRSASLGGKSSLSAVAESTPARSAGFARSRRTTPCRYRFHSRA